MKTAAEFWSKVQIKGPDECWPWIGGRSGPYGVVRWVASGAVEVRHAHTIAFELDQGWAPRGHTGVVRHRCHTGLCCNPAHLLDGDQVDNANDDREAGRLLVGRQRWNAKLTDEQVRAMRLSSDSYSVLGKAYGVSIATVHAVKHRKRWKHVV